MVDYLGNFVWPEPTKAYTAAVTVKHLLQWYKRLHTPKTSGK